MTEFLKVHKEGVILTVRVIPGAVRSSLHLDRPGELTVRLTSPPVDGRANKELARLLAKNLRIAPSNVTIIRGEKSRAKTVLLKGIPLSRAQQLIAELGSGPVNS